MSYVQTGALLLSTDSFLSGVKKPVVLLLDPAENIIDGDDGNLMVTASLTPESPKVYLAPSNRLVKPVREPSLLALSGCYL